MSLFDLNKDWHRPSVWGDDDDDTFYRWTRRQSASKPSASTAPRAEKPEPTREPTPEPTPEPEPEKEVETEDVAKSVEAAVQGVDLAFDMSVKRVKTEITSSRQSYGQKIARGRKRLRAAIRAGPVSG